MELLKDKFDVLNEKIQADGIVWLNNNTEGICQTCNHFKKLFYAFVLIRSKKVLTIECEDCFAEHY